MKKALILITALIGVLIGCEKDDICSDANANTPHLIIRFYNISNTSELKAVNNLKVNGLSNSEEIGITTTKDSIVLPLRVLNNNTLFSLTKDYTFNNNGTPDDTSDDITGGNPDEITISYDNEQVFISRACGYKNIYNNTTIGFTADSDNWILNTEIIQNTIENENNAHIHIYH